MWELRQQQFGPTQRRFWVRPCVGLYQSEGRDEVELQNVGQMREFLRLLLGDDWEIMLILANAIAGPDATDDQIYAAQQRAVHFVRQTSPLWREDMREVVAEVWLTLWLDPRPWLQP